MFLNTSDIKQLNKRANDLQVSPLSGMSGIFNLFLKASAAKSLSAGMLTACTFLSFSAFAEEESAQNKSAQPIWTDKIYLDGNGDISKEPKEDLDYYANYFLKWETLGDSAHFATEYGLNFYTDPQKDPLTDEAARNAMDIQVSFKQNYGDLSDTTKTTYVYIATKPLVDKDNNDLTPLLDRHYPTNLAVGISPAESDYQDAYIVIHGIDATNNKVDALDGLYYNHTNGNDAKTLTEVLLEKVQSEGGEPPSITGDFIRNNQSKTFTRNDIKTLLYQYDEAKKEEYPDNSTYKDKTGPHVKFVLEQYMERDQLTDKGKELLAADNIEAVNVDKSAGGTVIFNTAYSSSSNVAKPTDDDLLGSDEQSGILTKKSVLGDISGNFIGNYVQSDNDQILGGVIYNGYNGVIGTISGTFIGNNTQQSGAKTSHGGVIYNHLNGIINKIEGAFVDNFAVNTQNVAKDDDRKDIIGGVIVNHGVIEEGVHGTFIRNYAFSVNTANSGVLRNYSGPGYMGVLGVDGNGNSLSGDFIGNFARAVDGDAYGGIMRNNGTLRGNIEGAFIGNYAQAEGSPGKIAGGMKPDDSYGVYTVNREGTPVGKYRYDTWENKYFLYEEESKENQEKYKDKYVLEYQGKEIYHTGERTGLAQGGAFYNTVKTDGTAGTPVVLNKIIGTFDSNYVLSTWSEASGGAIYNQDAMIDDIEADFYGNHAVSLAHKARGGAIYNNLLLMDESKIGKIGSDTHTVQFTGNYAQGRIAGGGAIYVSSYATMDDVHAKFSGNYALSKLDLSDEEMKTYSQESSHFGEHGTREDDKAVRARGGALFVDNYGEVGKIYADFTGNYVKSDEMDAATEKAKSGDNADVRGGAILVTTNGLIGHIAGTDGEDSLALFKGNYALGADPERTFGGAIRFDASVIDTLSANFTGNYTNGSGGALSLTKTGFIYQVTGRFEGNTAGLVGGAVHNLGTIGYLGTITVMDPDTNGATYYDHLEDIKLYRNVNRLKSGRIDTVSDETKDKNKVGYKEYDGSIRGGFRNVQFIDNKVDGRNGSTDEDKYARNNGNRGLGGAIYTEGDIFIVADDNDPDNYTKFQGNEVIYAPQYGQTDYVPVQEDGFKHLNTALYVQKAEGVDELPTIYLVAQEGGHIIITDAIRGAESDGTQISEGFVLRMRGYTEKGFHYEHTDTSGVIELSGPVAQSYAIMDDVTLRIGQCVNYFSFGKGNGHDPDKYVFETDKKDLYGRSDVFRKSHLSVRSGTVDLTGDNGLITQFLFGTLTSYGYTYRYAEFGAADLNVSDTYEARDLYAKWAVDIDAKDKVADLITTFEIRSDDGNTILKAINGNEQKSTGRITLANINITRADGTTYEYDENGKTGDNDYGLDHETSLKVQVLNLVVRNEAGEVFSAEDYEKWGYLTKEAPIQLDNALRIVNWESSIMSSDEVLAEDIWLATTRTYHDSIEIIGWRDSLAAWAEMNDDISTANYDDSGWQWDIDENGNDTLKTQTKVFTLVRGKTTHTLTRDVVDLQNKANGAAERGAVWGKDWTIRGEDRTLVLDLAHKNLLTIVTEGQKARLENFTLQNVKNNDLLNEGELTLDTMTMHEKEMVVNNENSLTVQGVMDIDFTITTAANQRAVDDKEMIIDDRSHVTEGRTQVNIEGTVESQNITVKEELNKTALPADPTLATSATFADANFTTVVNLATTQEDGETASGAFTRFTQQDKLNSLHMEGGKFNLGVMHDHVLRLKNWSMKGGAMYVAASTVDLAAEKMGGIRADHASLSPENTGIIWLDKMVILNDGKGLVTHVQFVNEEMGDAVQDNDIRNTIKKGNIWYYEVTYNNETLKNDRGESGKNGWYTFRRLTDRVTPEVQTGASASLAGAYVSMMQVYDYSFAHADLFSSTMANSILNRFDAYSYVTPVKGYKEAPVAAAATSPCPTNKAGLQNALWVRPYASFEKLPLDNGPKVDTNLYGALFGGDSDLREHRGGWAEVTSIFGTYMGATKRYEGIRSRENGLGLGATETFYKGNFYTALTATVGTSLGSTHTAYGNEKYNTLMGGIASRTGYTMAVGSCDYVLQPTLLMSYTFINVSDYTNASGVRMESSPLQVFQVHPYLKGIMHTDSGWDPYITLGYVHNFMGKTKFRANGEKLPELSIDPYVEYSLGVQKTWQDKYTLYGQATGRHGGRNGAEVSVGIRWAW